MLSEKRELETLCETRMEEANRYSQALGQNRMYQPHWTGPSMQCCVTEKRTEVQAVSLPNSRKTTTIDNNSKVMSLKMFLREHKKMQEAFKKHLDQNAAQEKGKDAGLQISPPTKFDAAEVSLQAQSRCKPTRYQTQQELKAIVENTMQLTSVLQHQLDELRNCKWNNVMYA